MLDVLLYTAQPILALGLAGAFQNSNSRLAKVCTCASSLIEALLREHYDVLLLEAAADIDIELLMKIKVAAPATAIVIWAEDVSTDFVAQAVGLGVRGILRKNLSLELQVRCVEKVAAGEIWIEKQLVASLLSTQRIVLTRGERRIVVLIAQGLRNKEIAYRLGLTEGTVKVYLSRLFKKVDVSDRFELALWAIGHLYGGRSIPEEPKAAELPVAGAGPISGAFPPPAVDLGSPRWSAR